MIKKFSKLELAQQNMKEAAEKTNQKINELGEHTDDLYRSLKEIRTLFECIRNAPEENRLQYQRLKEIQLDWESQVKKIEVEYKKLEVKAAGQGMAGLGAGIAVTAFGPTAAMGVATTFGVASTGTAISALSGAAATNAALAWLGGGALAAGGGGMAAGSAFLALAGPVGWTIAGVSAVASGLLFFKSKSDKERVEKVYLLISNRDTNSYKLAIIELEERIQRIKKECKLLKESISKIKTYGTDYRKMKEKQQYQLGASVNLMNAATQLLVNPILGLQPKFSESDFDQVCGFATEDEKKYFVAHKKLIVSMADSLYKIQLDDRDKKLLVEVWRKNQELLASVQMDKKDLGVEDLNMIEKALNYKYQMESAVESKK